MSFLIAYLCVIGIYVVPITAIIIFHLVSNYRRKDK